jgi:hypothetical protein
MDITGKRVRVSTTRLPYSTFVAFKLHLIEYMALLLLKKYNQKLACAAYL